MTLPATDKPTPSEAQPPAALVNSLTVRAFGLTDPGRVRHRNEDNFLVAELSRTLQILQTSLPQAATHQGSSRGHVLLVADGLGGHAAGGIASSLTVEIVEAFVVDLLQAADEHGVLADLRLAVQKAHDRIIEESGQHPELAGMGTTLTLAFISGHKLFVLHAGDSRCYLLRKGLLRQITEDHTIVAELARRGVIKPEEACHHRLRHIVTNVLGGGSARVQVDVQKVDLEPGDAVLLCSDGLTDMVDDGRIATLLTATAYPKSACERLLGEANGKGGNDNITAIVARFDAA
jgi:PPM family protein phosphatase